MSKNSDKGIRIMVLTATGKRKFVWMHYDEANDRYFTYLSRS